MTAPIVIALTFRLGEPDDTVSCMFCRDARPCSYTAKLRGVGDTNYVGAHSTCLHHQLQQKARLDADGTAEPRTRLLAHGTADRDGFVSTHGGASIIEDTETGERTFLGKLPKCGNWEEADGRGTTSARKDGDAREADLRARTVALTAALEVAEEALVVAGDTLSQAAANADDPISVAILRNVAKDARAALAAVRAAKS